MTIKLHLVAGVIVAISLCTLIVQLYLVASIMSESDTYFSPCRAYSLFCLLPIRTSFLHWALVSDTVLVSYAVLCPVTQSYLTLYNPMNCSSPGSSVHGDSSGKNTRVGCHVLLPGIFPTQGLNPGIPHCRWILYHLSHQGSPRI